MRSCIVTIIAWHRSGSKENTTCKSTIWAIFRCVRPAPGAQCAMAETTALRVRSRRTRRRVAPYPLAVIMERARLADRWATEHGKHGVVPDRAAGSCRRQVIFEDERTTQIPVSRIPVASCDPTRPKATSSTSPRRSPRCSCCGAWTTRTSIARPRLAHRELQRGRALDGRRRARGRRAAARRSRAWIGEFVERALQARAEEEEAATRATRTRASASVATATRRSSACRTAVTLARRRRRRGVSLALVAAASGEARADAAGCAADRRPRRSAADPQAPRARRCRRSRSSRSIPTTARSSIPKVGEDVRRAALKKLFSDPHFNVMDGLDVYIDDYSKTEPIPAAMLAGLRQAQNIFQWAKEDAEARAGQSCRGGAVTAGKPEQALEHAAGRCRNQAPNPRGQRRRSDAARRMPSAFRYARRACFGRPWSPTCSHRDVRNA